MDDAELVIETQQQISEPPSYAYRRVWGLLRLARETKLIILCRRVIVSRTQLYSSMDPLPTLHRWDATAILL